MSVQRQSVPSSTDADLEATAELPVLDAAGCENATSEEHSGSTDTWHMPGMQAQAAATGISQAVPEENQSLQLEIDLRALSENLRDVEGRLTRKGERLVELERELANARADRLEADQRAASLLNEAEVRAARLVRAAEERSTSLAAEFATVRGELSAEQTRAASLQTGAEQFQATIQAHETRHYEAAKQLAAREQEVATLRGDLHELETRVARYLESLRTLEGRRDIFTEQLLDLDREIAARDAQIFKLRSAVSGNDGRAQQLAAELSARQQRIDSLERELGSLAASLGQRDADMQRLTQERDAACAKAATVEASLASATTALAEKARALDQSVAAGAELDKRLAESLQRIAQLENELAAARAEIAERVAAVLRVEAERDDHVNRLAAADTRRVELERRAEDDHESIRQLQEKLRNTLDRGTELEGDLRAAEDAINRLEAELHTKSAKLEDLTKTQEEWRNTIETARASLAERESLIHRLETEAANSALLLGNIQQSIRRLDPDTDSGLHEIAPEGAVRLLIRTDGDTEVVHVLGRKTTVGRTPDNDLQIDAKFISRNHAVIMAGPNHTIIEDLNSTNGVAVNNKRISRHTLRDGDLVSIGKTTFRFAVRPAAERR